MAQVYVSIGSNIDRDHYISQALDALHKHFGGLSISSVYESEAVGFVGDNFYNLVAGFVTDLPLVELSPLLKKIEDENGRCRKGPKFSGRTLDIDILTYDDLVGIHYGVQLPRGEITKNAFVLWPLAEIAADVAHPAIGTTYLEMWSSYDKARQKLWSIDFQWQGRSLPCVFEALDSTSG
ncbi:2-amino-4-hydroxy-6-hydroxymethyldihydropteridine diphosphokinase [Neptuniibacter sp. QD34_54]|uniref:2-amino-4-hydroxy-6- hydroxymethyldihydropteridine diphosphokinase n=1 Tax=Neptuniibacter sp. QD34_54 TaxID=3398208 RepID=UPI0039F4925C